MRHIGVIGAGAWGTALAMALRGAGREVLIWARDPALADRLNSDHETPAYLPDVRLDPALRATSDLAEATTCEALLLVVPAQHLRDIVGRLASCMTDPRPLVICAKGIEQRTGRLMSEVLDDPG